MSTAISKNPFELLEDDEDGSQPAAPVKEVRKEAPAAKKEAPKASSEAKSSSATAASAGGSRGGGGGGDRRPPKRQFDRHSGTGRGRASDGQEDKRGGQGKYNWGSKESGTTLDDEADVGKEMTEEEREAAEAAALERKKEEEKMSLDEYLKKKEEAKQELEKLTVREVEKLDMKGLKPLEKDDDELFVGEGAKSKKDKKKNSGRKGELVTDVGFKTAPPPDARDSPGGRGGRGGRGGGGRGGDRGPRGPRGGGGASQPLVLDDSAFPSLG